MTSIINMDTINNINNDNDGKEEYGCDTFTQDELEVASILLDLPNLFQPNNNNDHSNSNFPIWVSKKRRSTPDLPPVKTLNGVPSSPSTPLCYPTCTQEQEPTLDHNNKRKHSSKLVLRVGKKSREIEEKQVFIGLNNDDHVKTQQQEAVSTSASSSSSGANDQVHVVASTFTQVYQPPCDEILVEQQPKSSRRGLEIDLNIPLIEIEE